MKISSVLNTVGLAGHVPLSREKDADGQRTGPRSANPLPVKMKRDATTSQGAVPPRRAAVPQAPTAAQASNPEPRQAAMPQASRATALSDNDLDVAARIYWGLRVWHRQRDLAEELHGDLENARRVIESDVSPTALHELLEDYTIGGPAASGPLGGTPSRGPDEEIAPDELPSTPSSVASPPADSSSRP